MSPNNNNIKGTKIEEEKSFTVSDLKANPLEEEVLERWVSGVYNRIKFKFSHMFNPIFMKYDSDYKPMYDYNGEIFPYLEEIESVEVLERIRDEVENYDFDEEKKNKIVTEVVDSMIEYVEFEVDKLPLDDVEKIENSYVSRFYHKKGISVDDPVDLSVSSEDLNSIKVIIEEYDLEELRVLSDSLSSRNVFFRSPHANIVDVVRYSRGDNLVDFEDLVIIDGRPYYYDDFKSKVDIIISKMGEVEAGFLFARIDKFELYDRLEEIEPPVSEMVTLGGALNFRPVGGSECGIVLAGENVNRKLLEQNKDKLVSQEVNSYSHDSIDDRFNEVLNGESVTSHEVGHIANYVFGIDKVEKIKEGYEEYYEDSMTHLHENVEEMIAHCFDLWINNPEKVKEKYPVFYEYFENNLK